MIYSKIISYLYALIAIILGTISSLHYIDYYYKDIIFYNNKQLIETTAIIKNIDCYNKNSCYAEIEYTANNVKYIEKIDTPNNLKIGDKIKIKYNSKAERTIYYYNYNDNDIYYKYIYLILLIIFILLLWIFIIIGIIFSNKYIFLIYAIIATIIISYIFYNIIYNYYENYKNEDLYNYDDYKYYTIGIIKSTNNNNYSNIEYLIDDVKYNVNRRTIDYKVGENVKVYYNKDNPNDIKIYDKTEYKRKIILIILILFFCLLWLYLFFNIPFILKLI